MPVGPAARRVLSGRSAVSAGLSPCRCRRAGSGVPGAVLQPRGRLCPGRGDGRPAEARDGDGRVVDDAVDHHLGHVVVDRDGVDRDRGQPVGQLVVPRERVVGTVDVHVVEHHPSPP